MLFFDLDDTLLDHDAAARAGVVMFYETFRSHFNEDFETFLARWIMLAEKYFQSNNPVSYTLLEQHRIRMRALFPEALTDEEADARFQIYSAAYELNWKLHLDAIPCLQAFPGRQMGLITNGDGKQQRAKIKKFGLASYLSTVVISLEVGCAKPDKTIFELAAQQAGVRIGDCFYVGDRLETDALGSYRAGMKGIWLDRKGKGIRQNLEVPVIASLSELPSLLNT
jgi:putative hydrolase of the HAD superfamily